VAVGNNQPWASTNPSLEQTVCRSDEDQPGKGVGQLGLVAFRRPAPSRPMRLLVPDWDQPAILPCCERERRELQTGTNQMGNSRAGYGGDLHGIPSKLLVAASCAGRAIDASPPPYRDRGFWAVMTWPPMHSSAWTWSAPVLHLPGNLTGQRDWVPRCLQFVACSQTGKSGAGRYRGSPNGMGTPRAFELNLMAGEGTHNEPMS
jgi:hypothetical protein